MADDGRLLVLGAISGIVGLSAIAHSGSRGVVRSAPRAPQGKLTVKCFQETQGPDGEFVDVGRYSFTTEILTTDNNDASEPSPTPTLWNENHRRVAFLQYANGSDGIPGWTVWDREAWAPWLMLTAPHGVQYFTSYAVGGPWKPGIYWPGTTSFEWIRISPQLVEVQRGTGRYLLIDRVVSSSDKRNVYWQGDTVPGATRYLQFRPAP